MCLRPLLLGSDSASSDDASLTSGRGAQQSVAANGIRDTHTAFLLLANHNRLGKAGNGGATVLEHPNDKMYMLKQPGHLTSMK